MLNPLIFPIPGARLWSRGKGLAKPSPAPVAPGVYDRYFDDALSAVDRADGHGEGKFGLLPVDASPKEPPANGRAPSRSPLRKRLRTYDTGNASGWTPRQPLSVHPDERSACVF
jgi:hypothetical protein